MKRMLLLLLALLFALSCLGAAAETRTIMLEGEEEQITVERFESVMGYVIYYDASRFQVKPTDDTDPCDHFMPLDAEAVPGVEMRILLGGVNGFSLDDAAAQIQKELGDAGYTASEAETGDLLPGLDAVGYRGEKDGLVRAAIAVAGEGDVFFVTIDFPAEAEEGFSTRLFAMLNDFALPSVSN